MTAGTSISVNPDVVTVVVGNNVSTATITLQVPSDNLAHVWNILLGTGSSVNITLTDSTGEGRFFYPKGFEGFAINTWMEISIVGIMGGYFVRYGEFQSLLAPVGS